MEDWIPLDVTTLATLLNVSAQILAISCMYGLTANYHRSWYPLFKQEGTTYICWLFSLLRAIIFMGMGYLPSQTELLASFLVLDDDDIVEMVPLVLYPIHIMLSWILSFFFLTAKKLDDALLQLILMDTATAFCVLLSCLIDQDFTYRMMGHLFFILNTAFGFWDISRTMRFFLRDWRLAGFSQRSLSSRRG